MDHDASKMVPGLDDSEAVPVHVRIARYTTYLSEVSNPVDVTRLAAESSILLKDAMHELALVRAQLISAYESKVAVGDLMEMAANELENSIVISNELAEKQLKHATAGSKGGKVRALKLEPLKKWAIEKGGKLSGNPAEKARKLFRKLPPQLSALSNDPQRVMAQAIRDHQKSV
jgi:hypothetical protein